MPFATAPSAPPSAAPAPAHQPAAQPATRPRYDLRSGPRGRPLSPLSRAVSPAFTGMPATAPRAPTPSPERSRIKRSSSFSALPIDFDPEAAAPRSWRPPDVTIDADEAALINALDDGETRSGHMPSVPEPLARHSPAPFPPSAQPVPAQHPSPARQPQPTAHHVTPGTPAPVQRPQAPAHHGPAQGPSTAHRATPAAVNTVFGIPAGNSRPSATGFTPTTSSTGYGGAGGETYGSTPPPTHSYGFSSSRAAMSSSRSYEKAFFSASKAVNELKNDSNIVLKQKQTDGPLDVLSFVMFRRHFMFALQVRDSFLHRHVYEISAGLATYTVASLPIDADGFALQRSILLLRSTRSL